MATKPTPPSPPPGTDPFEHYYTTLPEVQAQTQLEAFEARELKRQLESFEASKARARGAPLQPFVPPFTPHVFNPALASPTVAAPRQALGSAEAAAWLHVVSVLSKTASPTKRKIMADKVREFTRGRGADELGIELPDVATLFHPESPDDAAAVLATLQQACKAGTLPSHGGWLYLSQLAAWPDIPAAATDSPLRFWLPFLPKAAAPVLELVPKATTMPTTWKGLVTYHKANPGHLFPSALKNIVAIERSRRGDQPGAAAAMAAELGISTSRVNELVRTKDNHGKRQAVRTQRTGTK